MRGKSSRRTAVTSVWIFAPAIVIFVAAIGTGLYLHYFRDQSLTRILDAGVIRIGYAVEAPYGFLVAGGEITGESPEVARVITTRLGIRRIEWRQMEFGSLLPALESGQFDVIAAGMFITPERGQRVLFSEPTFHVKQALLVQKGNPENLHSYEQAAALPNATIAVIAGSIEETLLRRIGLSDQQLVTVPDALAGRTAVESRVAHGLALSSPTIQWMAIREQLGNTEMAQPFEQPRLAAKERLGYGAFVFRREDRQLHTAWNSVLANYIGTDEHLELISAFGFTQAELPGAVTTGEVLSQP